ncbi:MAG: hypothetical protein RBS40_15505 [Rhodocyclaceae bacterium]|nr:hypothetical protein [Rhodocyclaceae bacterium]
MKNLISILLLLPLVACSSTPSKSELDAEVKRLCAIDGGIKVYEMVALPSNRFDSRGTVDIFRPGHGDGSLGAAYIYREEKHVIASGNPEMWRTHYQIIRKTDNKLLSEARIYIRRGGDAPGPWHDSYFSCPDLRNFGLVESTFRIQSK